MKIAVFFSIFLTLQVFAGSFPLVSDTLDLDIGTFRFIKFRVTPDQADSARIVGEFFTEPVPTRIEFLLITDYDYKTKWFGLDRLDTLAAVYAENGPFLMSIPDFGDYVLIVSNRGNRTPVSVAMDLSVVFSGSGETYDSLPFGMTLLMTMLAMGVLAAAVMLTLRKMKGKQH